MGNVMIIAIAGASGSGKTCLAKAIEDRLGDNVVFISHDSYYKRHDDINYEERCKLNYDEPDALETDLLIEHLAKLRAGEIIDCPLYDFTQHNRSDTTKRIYPKKVIVVEGILILENMVLRDMIDLKLYVDAPQEVSLIRRLQRDVVKRGRSVESVLRQYQDTVLPSFKRFIEPTKSYADIIVPMGGKNPVVQEMIINHIIMHLNTT